MDYLQALKIASRPPNPDFSVFPLELYSNWTPGIIETFLKAFAQDFCVQLQIQPNEFGSLQIQLQNLLENKNPNPPLRVIFLDEEIIVPGISLRSDALLTRTQIDKTLREAEPKILELIDLLSQLSERGKIVVFYSRIPPFPLLHTLSFTLPLFHHFHHLLQSKLLFAATLNPSRFLLLDHHESLKELSAEQILDDRLLFNGGWPFSTRATERIAQNLIHLIFDSKESRKILITDADNTLWSGLIGDDGVDHVHWDQEPETYRFFIYQKTLNLLMSEGILVAIASKNDEPRLGETLQRKDLILDTSGLFRIEASWKPKSQVIHEIIKSANLLPSAAVFIDDSDFELGEVQSALPEIQCLRFPETNSSLRSFLNELRGFFHTQQVTNEDRLRTQSLQKSLEIKKQIQTQSPEDFLKNLQMEASVEIIKPERSDRAFQLINKTNQFNLCGKRYELAEWKKTITEPDRLAFQLRFKDQYCDYGIISVLLGNKKGHITDWVLSCRVFSRTLEEFFLNFISQQLIPEGVTTLKLHYLNTGKNSSVRDFIQRIGASPNKTREMEWDWASTQSLKTFVSARNPDHSLETSP